MIKGDVRTRGEFQLTDALQMMIERGERMKTFPIDGWFDCGKPETLLETNRHLLTQNSTHSIPAAAYGCYAAARLHLARKQREKFHHRPVRNDRGRMRSSRMPSSGIPSSAKVPVSDSLLEDSIIGNNAPCEGRYKRINIGDSSELEFD